MSGITVTGAIVLALVAITIWVFAGGSDGGTQTTTVPAATKGTACQTPNGSNCVQAAQNLVQGLNGQAASQAQAPAPAYPATP